MGINVTSHAQNRCLHQNDHIQQPRPQAICPLNITSEYFVAG